MQHSTIERQTVLPAVLQRAEAQHFGSWLAGTQLKANTSYGCSIITIGVLVTSFVTIISSSVTQPAMTQYNNCVTYQSSYCSSPPSPFSTLLLAGILLGVTLISFLGWLLVNRRNRVDIFDEGMIWKHGGEFLMTSWKQISQITRGTYQAADSESHRPEGVSDLDTIRVRDKWGASVLSLDRSEAGSSVRARICDLVESEFVAHVLSATMQQYYAGTPLQFGKLSVSQQGFSHEDDLLPWQQIEHGPVLRKLS
jgi:hypothetical protein